MMIFSSLLYNCSPKGYRLLRDSKNIKSPNYSTTKRLTLPTYMNPLIEQHDQNFLMNIKNRLKLLEQKDTTVSLLVDEIRLNPFLITRVVILLTYLTRAMKLQQVLLLLCLAVYSPNIRILCMLCQLNVLNLRIYLTYWFRADRLSNIINHNR